MAILITGANRGIGLSLATQLHEQNKRVIAVCRSSSPELKSLGIDVIEGLDVTHPQGLKDQLQALDVTHLDVLINNAGILRNEHLGELDYEQIRLQFEVNTLGPLMVVEELLGFFSFGSKVINITSRMGSIADNSAGGRYGYRISKAASNMAAMSLAQDLKERGISVAVIHPGFVKTGMTGFNGLMGPEDSARGILRQIDQLTLDESGGFWHSNGERLPW